MSPSIWLRIAGLGTWLVSSLPALAAMERGALAGPAAWVWGAAFAGFGLAFLLSTCGPERRRATLLTLLVVQGLCALLLASSSGDGLGAATLVVVAAQVPGLFEARGALLWVALQTAVLLILSWSQRGAIFGITIAGAYGGFQLFALAAVGMAVRERRAREELSRVNAELTEARERLEESSRASERLRIARDLHDTLGHHLTALSLQLDVASRLSSGPAEAHVVQAHAITRLLLGDVRDVVGQLRDPKTPDVAAALRDLVGDGTPGRLAVHLDLPPDLRIDEPGRAWALIRAVQELMTNATRHGDARNLWIRVTVGPDGVRLQAHDDGRGTGDVRFGNGLTGMRQRFAEFAGEVEVTSAPGEGFAVRAWLPVAGA